MKKIFSIIAVFVLALIFTGCSVFPQTGDVIGETADVVLPTLDGFFAYVIQPLGALVLLVFINFFLGVVAAIRAKSFEWNRVGDYFGKYILSLIAGWLIGEFLAVIIPAIYSDLPEWVDLAAVVTLRFTAFSTVLGSILEKAQTFGLYDTGVGEFLGRIGVPRSPIN